MSSQTVVREFKTWNNAIAFLVASLKKKNMELKYRKAIFLIRNCLMKWKEYGIS